MPDLLQNFQGRDLGFIKIVAELWGVELSAPDMRVGIQRLVPALLNRDQVVEMLRMLDDGARLALDDLLRSEGRIPWALFTRRYGQVREMGAGRRDREHPFRNPGSPAEALWYRALIGRTFFDTPAGPDEFAYIPEDIIPFLPIVEGAAPAALGRPATLIEQAVPALATDRVIDDACTLLAALRSGLPPASVMPAVTGGVAAAPLAHPILLRLLKCAGLLDEGGLPQPEPTREFLEAARGEALARLARAWIKSSDFDEIRQVPRLRVEGEWKVNPYQARTAVLDFLSTIQDDGWWSISGFVNAIRQRQPDFLRPAGDYDSAFIRDEHSGEYLRGFEHWDDVDGALVRYIICGPLHWLGMIDLAAPAAASPPTAFRYTHWAADLLVGKEPQGLAEETEMLQVGSDAIIRAPRGVPRAVRYQVARFCTWEGEIQGGYLYRITPAALERAKKQGLKLSHLLSLLRKHAAIMPPNLVKALERWDEQGSQARLQQATILRLRNPELLAALRSSRAGRFLDDPLSPTTVVVKPGAWQKVLTALAEMGYLGEAGEEFEWGDIK